MSTETPLDRFLAIVRTVVAGNERAIVTVNIEHDPKASGPTPRGSLTFGGVYRRSMFRLDLNRNGTLEGTSWVAGAATLTTEPEPVPADEAPATTAARILEGFK